MQEEKSKLNIRNATIIIIIYLVLEIILNILIRLFFRTNTPAQERRIIDSVIGTGMIVNIIMSVLIFMTTISIFKTSSRDIYFERSKFSLSKIYYFFPFVWFAIALYALLSADLSGYKFFTILLVIPATLAIAFNEEVLTRGIMLTALRKKGLSEFWVFVISTLSFALMHFVNVLGGGPFTQMIIVIFGGALLYVSRRVFNNLVIPIILHAFFDTAIYLQTGLVLENQNLPDNILDFNLASFLILILAVVIFLIFGRKLLKSKPEIT